MEKPLSRFFNLFSYLVKRLGPISIATVYTNVLQFILFAFMAKYCPEESLGLYKYFLTIYALISMVVIPGAAYATKQFAAIDNQHVLSQAWKIKIKYSIYGTLLFILVIPIFLFFNKQEMFWPCIFGALLLPIFEAAESTQFYLSGKKDLTPYFNWTIIRHTAMFLGMVTVIYFFPDFIPGPTLSYLVFATLCSFFLFKFFNRKSPKVPTLLTEEYKNKCKEFSWVVWLNRIRSEADILILGSLFAFQEVAILAIGRQFLMLWKQAAQVTMLGVYNRLAIGSITESFSHLKRVFLLGGAVAVPSIILSVFLLPPLIRGIYGPAFENSIVFAQIFWLSAMIILPASHLNNWFQARGLHNPLLVLGAWSLGFDLIVLSGFIFVYGPIGIAYGEVTSQLFQLIGCLILAAKELKKAKN